MTLQKHLEDDPFYQLVKSAVEDGVEQAQGMALIIGHSLDIFENPEPYFKDYFLGKQKFNKSRLELLEFLYREDRLIFHSSTVQAARDLFFMASGLNKVKLARRMWEVFPPEVLLSEEPLSAGMEKSKTSSNAVEESVLKGSTDMLRFFEEMDIRPVNYVNINRVRYLSHLSNDVEHLKYLMANGYVRFDRETLCGLIIKLLRDPNFFGHIDLLKHVFDNGFGPDSDDSCNSGYATPLFFLANIMCDEEALPILDLLIEYGFDVNERRRETGLTVVQEQCASGSIHLEFRLRALESRGARLDAATGIAPPNLISLPRYKEGASLFDLISLSRAKGEYSDALDFLAEHIDVHEVDAEGNNLLHRFISAGQPLHFIEKLVALKVDVLAKNKRGLTPLEVEEERHRPRISFCTLLKREMKRALKPKVKKPAPKETAEKPAIEQLTLL